MLIVVHRLGHLVYVSTYTMMLLVFISPILWRWLALYCLGSCLVWSVAKNLEY